MTIKTNAKLEDLGEQVKDQQRRRSPRGSKNHCVNECHDQTLGNDQTEQQSKKLCTRPKAPRYWKGSSS